jgi:hypothetical protein
MVRTSRALKLRLPAKLGSRCPPGINFFFAESASKKPAWQLAGGDCGGHGSSLCWR